MKILTEINGLTRGAAILSLLLLPACTKAPWQREFWQSSGGSSVENPTAKPNPIRRASGENKDWPKLSSVPTDRPPRPLSEDEVAAQIKELEADREDPQP